MTDPQLSTAGKGDIAENGDDERARTQRTKGQDVLELGNSVRHARPLQFHLVTVPPRARLRKGKDGARPGRA